MRILFFDIEVYVNYFLCLIYDPYIKKEYSFEIYDLPEGSKINQFDDLKNYLNKEKNSYFTGYNSLAYDMALLTRLLITSKTTTIDNKLIKNINDDIIKSEWAPYKENELCNKTIDLMLVNNYGIRSAKSTSLKKLEFNLRKKKIQDLPYHFNSVIKNNKQRDEIVKYCKYDVETTVDVFKISKDLINLRVEFGKLHNLDLLNSPEPDLAKKFIYKKLAEAMNITIWEFMKLKTYQQEIVIKDIILDFINFDNPVYQEVKEFYENIVLTPTIASKIGNNKLINLKNAISKEINYKNLSTSYGLGGIHGAITSGVYVENEEYMITTADFKSYYPHLQFIHNSIAAHIPQEVYSNLIRYLFSEREKYPKTNILNYSIKIIINLLYGLSNSEYSALYDAKATLKTTINGMLILSMIADKVYQVDYSIILMKNTDGLEIYHKRIHLDIINNILDNIEKLTNIPIEVDHYNKLIIKDVNNYISVTCSGSIKTKGLFEDYNDIIKAKAYHKDTSAMIIPKALKAYFINGIPIEETINNENSIYEFCYGNKGSSQYKWIITKYDPNIGIAKSEIFDSRFIRYFAGGTTTISQLWVKGARENTIQAVQANTPVTMLMNVPKEDILDKDAKGNIKMRYDKQNNPIYRYPTLNRKWYIDECYKIINQIENN